MILLYAWKFLSKLFLLKKIFFLKETLFKDLLYCDKELTELNELTLNAPNLLFNSFLEIIFFDDFFPVVLFLV